jgi:hypothetical protein
MKKPRELGNRLPMVFVWRVLFAYADQTLPRAGGQIKPYQKVKFIKVA